MKRGTRETESATEGLKGGAGGSIQRERGRSGESTRI